MSEQEPTLIELPYCHECKALLFETNVFNTETWKCSKFFQENQWHEDWANNEWIETISSSEECPQCNSEIVEYIVIPRAFIKGFDRKNVSLIKFRVSSDDRFEGGVLQIDSEDDFRERIVEGAL